MEGQNCRIGKVWTKFQLNTHIKIQNVFNKEKMEIQKIMNDYAKLSRRNQEGIIKLNLILINKLKSYE